MNLKTRISFFLTAGRLLGFCPKERSRGTAEPGGPKTNRTHDRRAFSACRFPQFPSLSTALNLYKMGRKTSIYLILVALAALLTANPSNAAPVGSSVLSEKETTGGRFLSRRDLSSWAYQITDNQFSEPLDIELPPFDQLKKADAICGKGSVGTVSRMTGPDGFECIAKQTTPKDPWASIHAWDTRNQPSKPALDLKGEYKAYLKVYKANDKANVEGVGQVYGTAHIQDPCSKKPKFAEALIMKRYGADGANVMQALLALFEDKTITEADYWNAVAYLSRQVFRGLSAIHRAKMSHDDMHGNNFMVGFEGEVVIVDFGYASDHTALPPNIVDWLKTRGPKAAEQYMSLKQSNDLGVFKDNVYDVMTLGFLEDSSLFGIPWLKPLSHVKRPTAFEKMVKYIDTPGSTAKGALEFIGDLAEEDAKAILINLLNKKELPVPEFLKQQSSWRKEFKDNAAQRSQTSPFVDASPSFSDVGAFATNNGGDANVDDDDKTLVGESEKAATSGGRGKGKKASSDKAASGGGREKGRSKNKDFNWDELEAPGAKKANSKDFNWDDLEAPGSKKAGKQQSPAKKPKKGKPADHVPLPWESEDEDD